MAVKCIDNNTNYELITIKTQDEQINKWANDYIQTYHINVQQSTGFTALLICLSDKLDVDKTNTGSLAYYFNIYINLCSLCSILPDMTGYCVFIDCPYDTARDWMSGQNRSATHTPLFQKMREICKMTCVTEAGHGNVGAIYVAKAIHGLSDSPAPSTYTQNNLFINTPPPAGTIGQKYLAGLADKAIDVADTER